MRTIGSGEVLRGISMVKYHEKYRPQEMKGEQEGKQRAIIVVILGVSRDRELSAFEGGILSAVISAD